MPTVPATNRRGFSKRKSRRGIAVELIPYPEWAWRPPHRRRVDEDPLELVQVQAQRVGQDRLDDVAVAARDPDVVRGEPGVPVPHRGDGPRGHLGQRLPAGEPSGGRLALHDGPERLLGE